MLLLKLSDKGSEQWFLYKLVTKFYDRNFEPKLLKLKLQIFTKYWAKLPEKELQSLLTHFQNITEKLINEDTTLQNSVLVLPAKKAAIGRSFSMLRLIKSCRRSVTGQSRLYHLVLIGTCKVNFGTQAN